MGTDLTAPTHAKLHTDKSKGHTAMGMFGRIFAANFMEGIHQGLEAKARSPWMAVRRSHMLRKEMAKLELRRVAEMVINAKTPTERDQAMQQAARYVATGQMANWKDEYELEEAAGRLANAKTASERTDIAWDYITKGDKRKD